MSSARTEPRRRKMRIASRLTLWGTASTLAICAAVCVALYIGLDYSLHAEIDQFLEGEVQEFQTMLHDEGGQPFSMIESHVREEIGSRAKKDLTLRLLDSNGNCVISSNPSDFLPKPDPHMPDSESMSRGVWFDTIRIDQPRQAIRTCNQLTDLPGRGAFISQATYTLSSVESSLARFRNLCLTVMAFALGLSAIGGRLLARKSLRPVNEMSHAARRIETANITERLDRSHNGDELDQLAAVLNEMLERLEAQVNRIQQFTADAAHELRTPLAALRGNAEVALGPRASDEDRRRALEEGIEEYDRLSRLTDDLLLLARADVGRDLLRRESVSVETAVRDVVDLYSPLAQEKDVSLNFVVQSVESVRGDGGRIRQVISNLLDNAVKYSPQGSRVTITLDRQGDHAIVTVADTGGGIPEEHLPHIFERFYRADAARARSMPGFGLGLAICRTIVEAHGGGISIRSSPGTGTEVSFTLPHGESNVRRGN